MNKQTLRFITDTKTFSADTVRLRELLIHFASCQAMNIAGLEAPIIDRLIEVGLVHSQYDLYLLSLDDLTVKAGLDPKQAHNLLEEIDKSRDVRLKCFIYALGITGVDETAAQALAGRYVTVGCFITDSTMYDLTCLRDVDASTARRIVTYLNNPANIDTLTKLHETLRIIQPTLMGPGDSGVL